MNEGFFSGKRKLYLKQIFLYGKLEEKTVVIFG